MTTDQQERQFENLIGNLLRVGVVSAALVVFAGGIWHIATSGSRPVAFRSFSGEPQELTSPGGIVAGLMHGDSSALIQAGLLLLIATPVARVLFALVGFAVQKDRLYVAVTAIVLATLIFSLSGG